MFIILRFLEKNDDSYPLSCSVKCVWAAIPKVPSSNLSLAKSYNLRRLPLGKIEYSVWKAFQVCYSQPARVVARYCLRPFG